MKNKIINIVFILLLVTGFYFILRNIKLNSLLGTLKNVDYSTFIIASIIYLLSILLLNIRFYLLVKNITNLGFKGTSKINLISLLSNFASPGKVGIPVKVVLLKKVASMEFSKSTPVVMVEQILDIFGLILFSIIGILMSLKYINEILVILLDVKVKSYASVFLLFFILGLMVMVVIYLLFKKKLSILLKDTFLYLKLLMNNRRLVYTTIFITLITYIITFIASFLFFKSFNLPITFSFVIFIMPISVLFGYLSPLPGGSGVREFIMVSLYGIIYSQFEVVFIVAIVTRFIYFINIIILYLIGEIINKKSEDKYGILQ